MPGRSPYTVKLGFPSIEAAEEWFEEVRLDHFPREAGLRLQEVSDIPSPTHETPLIVTDRPGMTWVVPPIEPVAAAPEEGSG